MRRESGVTLIELVVAMLVLSLLTGLAGVLFLAHTRAPSTTAADALRLEAVRQGRVITDDLGTATYLPDGRVIGRPSSARPDSRRREDTVAARPGAPPREPSPSGAVR